MQTTRSPSSIRRLRSRRFARRRATIFVLVIGISMLVTVMAMGAIATARLAGAEAETSADWEEAGVLAQAAVEHALSYMTANAAANPTTWRAAFTSFVHGGSPAFSCAMGRGTFSWEVIDSNDPSFSSNYQAPFRLYGIGTVNRATRCFSVMVVPGGGPLDALRCGLVAGGAVTVNSPTVLSANCAQSSNNLGTISSNTSITVGGPGLYGNAEAPSFGNNSASHVTGSCITTTAKAMPSQYLYNLYLPKATTIPWTDVTGNQIQNGLISATSTPFGLTNAEGIYSITVPTGTNLTLKSLRIVGTLLISINNANLTLAGPIAWSPMRPDYPILIVLGSNNNIQFQGSNQWLEESQVGVDLNGNGTLTDDFMSVYQGLIHIAGSTNAVTLQTNTYVNGSLLTDGTVTLSGSSNTLVSDPNLWLHPPIGYGSGSQLMPVPGTWLWDSPP